MEPFQYNHLGGDVVTAPTTTRSLDDISLSAGTPSWDPAQLTNDGLGLTRMASPESMSGEPKDIRMADPPPTTRKRISRACDQSFGLVCEYKRERKKRGKVSRKDLQHQHPTTAATLREVTASLVSGHSLPSSEAQSPIGGYHQQPPFTFGGTSTGEVNANVPGFGFSNIPDGLASADRKLNNFISFGDVHALPLSATSGVPMVLGVNPHPSQAAGGLPGWSPRSDVGPHSGGPTPPNGFALGSDTTPTADHYGAMFHTPGLPDTPTEDRFHTCACAGPCHHVSAAAAAAAAAAAQVMPMPAPGITVQRPSLALQVPAFADWSSDVYSLPSPAPSFGQHSLPEEVIQSLRYPVLQPLLPYLDSTISSNMACDLLEIYFTEFAHSSVHPLSPYILGYAFRKDSFLRSLHPRASSPALLASMLWVAARVQHQLPRTPVSTDPDFLCRELFELTLKLLKLRMNEGSRGAFPAGGGPVTASGHWHEHASFRGAHDHSYSGEVPSTTRPSVVDDIATYMNLGVISAHDRPSKSLRWWNMAFALAKSAHLNQESPPQPSVRRPLRRHTGPPASGVHEDANMGGYLRPGDGAQSAWPLTRATSPTFPTTAEGAMSLVQLSEEEKEERRRIWWLLYILDRHMALCCERFLTISDADCRGVLEPMDETRWQAGDFDGSGAPCDLPRSALTPEAIKSGVPGKGHTIFAYFLPLMTVASETFRVRAERSQLASQHPQPLRAWTHQFPSAATPPVDMLHHGQPTFG
ncbi:MAG: hypothetical protein M1823_005195 [Watsoniomyces obsoletus]|nr:MAG: hypothetical protein M1823_005195 [Watsoniomyces obsoletus]